MLDRLLGGRNGNTITELDGVRGLAVLMVFFYHILGVLGITAAYVGSSILFLL